MDKETEERLAFLKEQLEWSKRQALLLEELDAKLHEMKEIAEYVQAYEWSSSEIDDLNQQFKELQQEVAVLQRQLNSTEIH